MADLHRLPTTAARAPTRTGARPRRLLACYRQLTGLTLDPHGHLPLPAGPTLRPAEIRTVLDRTLSVPDAWTNGQPPHPEIPEAWHAHPLLHDLVLLVHDPAAPAAVPFGRHLLRLDDALGLVHNLADRLPRDRRR
ncbi:hypothetical protein ACFYVL_31520 [Streptomyces sp. NPDC004111]|uniref:hypothetical protein n=1 Tax=Streptomyces sp. NPDC004111 TaxID=3364690 RepID=UPI0036C56A4E